MPELTDSQKLDFLLTEMRTLRKLVSEAVFAQREAEGEVHEKMRRFANYYHDIVHIKGEYVSLGMPTPRHIDDEMERCHDRFRQLLDQAHTDGGIFERVRKEMAADPNNRYDHTRQLTKPKES